MKLLFQACSGKFTYTLVHWQGKNNQQTVNNFMYAFKFMESHTLEIKLFFKSWNLLL